MLDTIVEANRREDVEARVAASRLFHAVREPLICPATVRAARDEAATPLSTGLLLCKETNSSF